MLSHTCLQDAADALAEALAGKTVDELRADLELRLSTQDVDRLRDGDRLWRE